MRHPPSWKRRPKQQTKARGLYQSFWQIPLEISTLVTEQKALNEICSASDTQNEEEGIWNIREGIQQKRNDLREVLWCSFLSQWTSCFIPNWKTGDAFRLNKHKTSCCLLELNFFLLPEIDELAFQTWFLESSQALTIEQPTLKLSKTVRCCVSGRDSQCNDVCIHNKHHDRNMYAFHAQPDAELDQMPFSRGTCTKKSLGSDCRDFFYCGEWSLKKGIWPNSQIINSDHQTFTDVPNVICAEWKKENGDSLSERLARNFQTAKYSLRFVETFRRTAGEPRFIDSSVNVLLFNEKYQFIRAVKRQKFFAKTSCLLTRSNRHFTTNTVAVTIMLTHVAWQKNANSR